MPAAAEAASTTRARGPAVPPDPRSARRFGASVVRAEGVTEAAHHRPADLTEGRHLGGISQQILHPVEAGERVRRTLVAMLRERVDDETRLAFPEGQQP